MKCFLAALLALAASTTTSEAAWTNVQMHLTKGEDMLRVCHAASILWAKILGKLDLAPYSAFAR